jgi:hypothetical protein
VNDTDAADVAGYAEAVRAAFDDLPEADSEELLEDLESHLEEVLAETGGPLSERLGPPAAYADELRASAGLPPRHSGAARRRRPGHWLRESSMARGVRALAARPAGRAVLDFLPQLRPAWWVLRGYLAVQLASALLTAVSLNSGMSFPVPSLFGSRVLGLLVTAGAVVGSVAIARRGAATRRARRLLALGNAGLVVFALVLLASAGSGASIAPSPAVAYEQVAQLGLRQDGREITNIFPFDAQGRPLRDVYLVDQDGNPIRPTRYDRPEVRAQLPRDAAGNEIGNLFPQRQVEVDPFTGEQRPAPTPGFQPPPTTTPAPSTTAAPTTTTTPSTTTGTAPSTTRR